MIGWTARTLPGERHAWSDKTGGCEEPRTLDSVKLPQETAGSGKMIGPLTCHMAMMMVGHTHQ